MHAASKARFMNTIRHMGENLRMRVGLVVKRQP